MREVKALFWFSKFRIGESSNLEVYKEEKTLTSPTSSIMESFIDDYDF